MGLEVTQLTVRASGRRIDENMLERDGLGM
jgi:hypothetical protein